MIRERSLVFLLAFGLLVSCCTIDKPPAPSLANASPSVDDLVDRLLKAVAANDPQALHALRVSEAEYGSIIIPGTVEVGHAQRDVDASSRKLFWSMLDTKSRDFARQVLLEFGGKKLTRTSVHFTRDAHAYSGYTAYGQVRVAVTDETGAKAQLRSGTIAQVGDQYKFIGLNWDD